MSANSVVIDHAIARLGIEARHHAHRADHARRSIAFAEANPGVGTFRPMEWHIDEMIESSRAEAVALRGMNKLLLDAGLRPGQQAEVAEEVYRVARFGMLAVHLGRVLPDDDTPPEADAALDAALECDPGWSEADELAERRGEYADAIRCFH